MPRVRILYVDEEADAHEAAAAAAAQPLPELPPPPVHPRLTAIKAELDAATDDRVRAAGSALIDRLRVCMAAAFARRVDAAVAIRGYQREKEALASDAARHAQEAERLRGVKADIRAARTAMNARAKAMRADEAALTTAVAALEDRKGRFDASAEGDERRADATATAAENAKQESLFRQLLDLIRTS